MTDAHPARVDRRAALRHGDRVGGPWFCPCRLGRQLRCGRSRGCTNPAILSDFYFFISSLDIPSLDILSFFIGSFDMLSLCIESFFIEPFDMFSLDIMSFFVSSAKATGARIRPAVISVEKSVLFRIGYTPVD